MHSTQTASVHITADVMMVMRAIYSLEQTYTNARLKNITAVQMPSAQTTSVHIIALVMQVLKATDGLAQT